jgi:hypothetical protein
MKYIKYTQVDAITHIPVTEEPAVNGPASPVISGLVFGFALESQYPTATPTFYGTCDVNADTSVPGVILVIDQDTYENEYNAEIARRVTKARAKKLDDTAAKRWTVESGGVTVTQMGDLILPAPVTIQTAKDDQDRINSVLTNMERYSLPSVQFKGANNSWVTLTYENLKYIGKLVVDHVQACFNAEAQHASNLMKLTTVEEVEAYDVNAGWPAN